MKKLSTKDIFSIAVATAATAAVIAGVVVIVKKCKKAIDAYEQEMLDAEKAEAEETVKEYICNESESTCETVPETPCACEVEQAEETIPQPQATADEETIDETMKE